METNPDVQNPTNTFLDKIQFSDIFNLEDIQRLQDLFADAKGVASVITQVDGTPITNPSNFCRLYTDLILKTEKGYANYLKSNAELGRKSSSGPIVHQKLSGGLWDAGARIIVDGRHIANWIIGQVKNEGLDIHLMINYADEIGVDREDFLDALDEVPVMSVEELTKISETLFIVANEYSEKAYSHWLLSMQTEEREKVKVLLEESEEKFEMLFNKAPFGYQALDFNGNFLEVNQTWLDILGYTKQEVIGKWFGDFISPAYQHAFREDFAIFKKEGKTRSEFEMVHKNGNHLFIAFDGKVGYDLNGEFKQTYCIFQDITERKKMEEALHKSNARLKLAIEMGHAGVWDLNLTDHSSERSLSHDQIFGYATLLPNWTYEMFLEHILPEDRQEVDRKFREAIATNSEWSFDCRICRIDGKVRWIYSIGGHVLNSEGKSVRMSCLVQDITERKLIEEARRCLEEKLNNVNLYARSLLEVNLDPMITINLDRRITDVNSATERATGFMRNDLIGTVISDYFTEPDKAGIIYKKVMHEGFLTDYPLTFRHISNKLTDVSLNASIYRDKNKKIKGILIAARDITARKHVEMALRESELKYRELVENSPDAIILYMEGNVVMVNNECVRLMRAASAKELIGKPVIQFVHPDYRDFVKDRMKKIAAKEVVLPLAEEKFIRLDGSEFDVEVKAMAIRLDNKPAIQLIVRDITERKLAEQKLRESEERLKEAQHIALIGNWHLKLDTGELTFSDEMYSIFEVEVAKSAVTFDDILSAVHPDDWERVNKVRETFKETRNPYETDYRLLLHNGRLKYVHECCEIFCDSGGNPLRSVGTVQDITWRKQAEYILKEKNTELQKRDADKDRFISILAHDLKSPFNAILGFIELLTENIRKYDLDTIENHLILIDTSIKRAYNLLEDLLLWARSQMGKIPFEPQELNTMAVFQDVLANMKLIAANKDITINLSATEEIPIYADMDMLKTIIRNLVTNAIKYSNPGGRIEIKAQQNDSETTISVSDNGIGIAPEMVSKLFDISQLQSTKGTANEIGTGLGLFLIKEFIEKHGGKIWVESELQNFPAGEAGGSIFYFALPHRVKLDETILSNNTVLVEEEKNQKNKLKILIAEDDETSGMLLEILVSKMGEKVIKAKNGYEAVDACLDNPDLDLVLMDIQMPEMNGYEATRQIRLFNPEVIIIAQTAYIETENREKAIKAGCNEYISKPIKSDNLMVVMNKYF